MNSLRFRLFAALFAAIALTIAIVGLALLALLWNSPLVDRAAVTRLTTVARGLAGQALLAEAASDAQLEAAARRIAQTQDVRVLLLDASGQARLDTQPDEPAMRVNLRLSRISTAASGARQGRARDEAGDAWTYVAQPLGEGHFLVLAVPQPRFPVLTFFVEDLLGPLLQAGAIAAAAALLLALILARSIAGPLQKMAAAAQGIARGDYSRAAPSGGPDEVRALGQALNDMAAQIRATQKAQHDFLGNVSHELKTPLTSIQGFAQAIQDGAADSPEAVQRSAGIIFDEAERMRRLVEELLELTRLDAGLRALRREPVDLRGLLTAALERFQLQAQEKQIALGADLAAGLPVIKGDADRLAQVFTNLLDNALKHTPAGGRVRLAAEPVPDGVQVSVADTGAGIPAEDLGRIFERFYQVDKSRARPGGVGLGLAITREIVLAHRGTINVESMAGLGTRFTVRLPLAWPEDSTVVRRR